MMTNVVRAVLVLVLLAYAMIAASMLASCSPEPIAAVVVGFHCAQVSDERGYLETDAAGNTIVDLHFCDPPFSTAGVFTALMAARQP